MNFFDNVKLKYKFIFLFVFCVLIPVIGVDAILLTYINNNDRQKRVESLMFSAERVKNNLITMVDECLYISDNIYIEKAIYSFVTKEYKTPTEYYDAYLSFQESNGIKHLSTITCLDKITVYADNHTILNGGYYRRLTEKEAPPWYAEYYQSGKDVMLYEGAGSISIIRKMDYYEPGREIFLKLDINYNKLRNTILNEHNDSSLLVFSGENLLFSNDYKRADSKDPSIFDIVYNNGIYLEKIIPVIDREWRLTITANTIPLWTSVLSEKENALLILLINLVLPTFFIYILEHSLVTRLELLETNLDKVESEQFVIIEGSVGKDEIGGLIGHYNLMIQKIEKLIRTIIEKNEEQRMLELSKKQAELNALVSQVNPHFMYNTLECICMRSLIKGEKETAGVVRDLSALLRQMTRWREDSITFGEELQFAEMYLKIQKYRYSDKLTYAIDITDDCREAQIPKMAIISFVENACVHGLEGVTGKGAIVITVRRENKCIHAQIQDTGCGMTEELLENLRERIQDTNIELLYDSKNTGVLNAYIRLRMYFGDRLNFNIESRKDYGTKVSIKIKTVPALTQKEDHQ